MFTNKTIRSKILKTLIFSNERKYLQIFDHKTTNQLLNRINKEAV